MAPENIRLDEIDIRMLSQLQHEGRISKSALAARVNLSVSACFERMQRLERQKLILSYHARINPALFGALQPFQTHVVLKAHRSVDFTRFETYVRSIRAITECHALGGGVDYTLTVLARNVAGYQRVIDTMLDANVGIDRYFTYVVTKTVKQAQLTVEEISAMQSGEDEEQIYFGR